MKRHPIAFTFLIIAIIANVYMLFVTISGRYDLAPDVKGTFVLGVPECPCEEK